MEHQESLSPKRRLAIGAFIALMAGAGFLIGRFLLRPAKQVAQPIAFNHQAHVEEADVDGYNLAYTVLPECFEDFVELVVPELQRRGLQKTAYAPGTMRHKLFGRGDRVPDSHPAARFRRLPRAQRRRPNPR